MNVDIQERLISEILRTALVWSDNSGKSGILDPEYGRTKNANPRYQEVCLTLALAVKLRIGLPDDVMDVELETAAVKSINGWLALQHRSGGIRIKHRGSPDPQATAFGAYAIVRSLILLGDLVPSATRNNAEKALKRTARFLTHHNFRGGLEALPIRFAALKSIAVWFEDNNMRIAAEKIHQEGIHILEQALEGNGNSEVDASALSISLAYLTLMVNEPSQRELALWEKICKRCLLSTAENGIFGGGAETSIASLPITTGFELLAGRIPEAAEIVRRLEKGWKMGFYSGMLDAEVPWLIPVSYLIGFGLAERRSRKGLKFDAMQPNAGTGLYGEGLIDIGEWKLRLGRGGTIGWIHHKPSDSIRIFGSPAGLALREGPWLTRDNLLYHASLAGAFPGKTEDPWCIEGNIYPVKVPGTERPPGRVGFPKPRGKEKSREIRLVPYSETPEVQRAPGISYKREIMTKSGALTIETQVEGNVVFRIPVVWLGGKFGKMKLGKLDFPPELSFQKRGVREITLEGGPWPGWTIRFDKPVDLVYDAILGPVTAHPMRFLSVAAGTIDVIAQNRLHMAIRV
ncbi:MAG: hypothetical protein P9L92_17780 [Candidatus Electryonea clarkiae]|nr:hypothetical protein [Candidatus Electryonea clarkiae]MDP8286848.1 hypothetical protein [Candidatus Electryonea clarkiae]